LTKTVEMLHLKAYGDIRSALASGSGDIGHAPSLVTWGTHSIPKSYFDSAAKLMN